MQLYPPTTLRSRCPVSIPVSRIATAASTPPDPFPAAVLLTSAWMRSTPVGSTCWVACTGRSGATALTFGSARSAATWDSGITAEYPTIASR
ncbi:hypothetical protein O1L60_12195 [Streptomyces diastatochromogenes]|nr:hypothetical protein [Streptomyces diastatochromogenes]